MPGMKNVEAPVRHDDTLASSFCLVHEFHKLILDEFGRLPGEAVDNARKTFREAVITADGVDLEQADLRRSTTTWTYMVHDSPFSSGGAKALQGIIGIFR